MLTAGTLLQNRYRIKRKLAEGGMGAVYEAEAVHLGRAQVAVKETFFAEEFLREQFGREAATLARLRHPALPKVTDHFSEGAGQFLVMEFIPGQDLLDLLTEQVKTHGAPFAWELVCQWADKLLDALDYIHNQYPPVIHRDIKPQNLKLTPQGEIILLDFGLAKDATTPTRPGGSVRAYTAEYAPPEQLKFAGTDARSDLFALSATLYHLMTGQPPVSAKVREEMQGYSMPDPMRPAHQQQAQIPFAIAAVLARAMALDRERRYGTAQEMRQALQQAQQDIAAALLEEQRARERQEAERQRQEQERVQAEQRQETERLQAEQRQHAAEIAERERQEQQRQQADQAKAEAEAARRRASQATQLDQARTELPLPPSASNKFVWLALAAAAFIALSYWGWTLLPAKVVTPANNTPAPVTGERVEALRYALELEGESGRVTTLDLGEGKRFKLHFTPSQKGYLYLLAPGEGDRLTTILAAQRLAAGADFAFPTGDNWINFSAESKSVPVIVVFAAEPITRLNFLTKADQVLTSDQRQSFGLLRELSATASPRLSASRDAVSVSMGQTNQPLVFDIVFERR